MGQTGEFAASSLIVQQTARRASAVATSLGAFLFFGEEYNDSGSLSDYATRF